MIGQDTAVVFVTEYDRFRLGRWEHVRSHTRRYPGAR